MHFYFDGKRAIDALVTIFSNDADATTVTDTWTSERY